MPKHHQTNTYLVSPRVLVETIYYGPYSRYWWQPLFIVIGNKDNNKFLPGYICHCGDISVLANDPTTAVSKVYSKIFVSATHYSVRELSKDIPFIPQLILLELKKIIQAKSPNNVWKISGLIKKFNDNQLFEYNIMKSLYDFHLKKRMIANIDWYQLFVKWNKQINPIIKLYNELINIYTKDHKFNERELKAWSTFLRTAGFLINNPNFKNSTQTFWKCFSNTLEDNKKNQDGKLLSIVADNFNYEELQENLKDIISESRKHARTNGYGAPPLDKPIFHQYVNMSSYKTDNTSRLPILYLQDCKQTLWKKFHERFPNGMQKTSFMTRLDGKRFVYKENLGGLCSECNKCGYQNELISEVQNLRRYLRRDYAKHLKVTQSGIAIHDYYLSHCLCYAFGDCQESHPDICTNCENLFIFFKNLKENLPSNLHSNLDEFQKRLIAFMSHYTRKTYLNTQLPAALSELEFDNALIIVDYKMRINPKKAKETKDEWFGKRGWTLHSILLYTKNQDTNNIDINAFDHWSGDTKQDAWFTASSLHGVVETLEKKPKNITISHIIKRYVKLGYEITSGEDIEKAISNLSDTHVANLQPNRERENEKQKLRTISGIRNWNEFTWIYNGEEADHIYSRPLPKFGELNKFSPDKIKKNNKKQINYLAQSYYLSTFYSSKIMEYIKYYLSRK
ncbi:hypothetical protein Glove_115g1 [Diversispora epigaea]|uniref:Uncharacterized protein n=1 Tax=Diversispora epigaea TaxID=1348612 RepID=A0A397J4R9_9GLOM|nr:hypothetical protein Glove_115g1 [Diversispora epigaea]